MFGQVIGWGTSQILVINWVGKIADFGHKRGKDFGKRAAHPHPILYPLSGTRVQYTDLKATTPNMYLGADH